MPVIEDFLLMVSYPSVTTSNYIIIMILILLKEQEFSSRYIFDKITEKAPITN
jgi:hypothetical protein